MILADRFIYIHQPKTGGTFVTRMLHQLHKGKGLRRPRLTWLGMQIGYTGGGIIDTDRYGAKHSECRQVPWGFRDRTLVSTMRNPYDYYVSEYQFGWWKQYPERVFADVTDLQQHCPDFASWSFADYVQGINRFHRYPGLATPHLAAEDAPGWLSRRFLHLFGRKPLEQMLQQFTGKSGSQGHRPLDFPQTEAPAVELQPFLRHLFPVTFLKTERLNQDLYDFLRQMGYAASGLDFILTKQKVKPPLPSGGTERHQEPWEAYYTPDLKALVRHQERLLFEIFPEYDR